MKKVEMMYNPYLLKTILTVDGRRIGDDRNSSFYKFSSRRMQQWLEKRGVENWEGFLPWLRKAVNDEEVLISFTGTTLDFLDLKELVDKENAKDPKERALKRIDLEHANAASADNIDPAEKLKKLGELYEKVKKEAPDKFRTDAIEKSFASALNDNFRIVIIAPMSSGKSTLLNAIMGMDLLPATNQATTSVITSIRDVDGEPDFTVSAWDNKGVQVCNNKLATAELIRKLNGEKDLSDPEGQKYLIKEIKIQGDIQSLSSIGLHTVFVDTPGGNNSLNREHRRVMDDAITKEEKCLVIYVFNGTNPSADDNALILRKIAYAMKSQTGGKQSRDRFLFVANKMDNVDYEKESYEGMHSTILRSLEQVGITDPNLFMVSAETCKLFRMNSAGIPMTTTDRDRWALLCKLMNDDHRKLFRYSSVSESQKQVFEHIIEEERAKYPGEANIPRIAEINSGIPALEIAINEYLEKYAIAIKLQTAQASFMSAMEDEKEKGTAWRNMAENEAALKDTRKKIDVLQDKLRDREDVKDVLQRIDEISFDPRKIWDEVNTIQTSLREYADQYEGETILEDDAEYLADDFRRVVAETLTKVGNVIAQDCMEVVQRECDVILAEYYKLVDSLGKAGLLEIGGIRLDQLGAFKSANERLSEARNSTLALYTHSEDRAIKSEKEGLFPAIGRGIGKFFGWVTGDTPDWGYDYKKGNVVDLAKWITDVSKKIGESAQEDVKEQIADAERQLASMKEAAKHNIEAIDSLLQETIAEVDRNTKDAKTLEKVIADNQEAYEFAEVIIREVEKLLSIE